MDRGQQHFLIDVPGVTVQGSPEKAGEAQDIVHLVVVIGATRCHDSGKGLRFFRQNFGNRIGHGKDDRIPCHFRDILSLKQAGTGQTNEDIGAPQGVSQTAFQPFRIGCQGEFGLERIHVFLPSPMQNSPTVAADNFSDPCG
ncbi:MAG: hypothetical protein A4E74_02360 [Syntrophus sp. PtaB.Bin075]|nr:MAG: hypothetical protein A4E74_02360 [Syntrophus sp. PtaB.Bin075]